MKNKRKKNLNNVVITVHVLGLRITKGSQFKRKERNPLYTLNSLCCAIKNILFVFFKLCLGPTDLWRTWYTFLRSIC